MLAPGVGTGNERVGDKVGERVGEEEIVGDVGTGVGARECGAGESVGAVVGAGVRDGGFGSCVGV